MASLTSGRRSNPPRLSRCEGDCFVAALLAMTQGRGGLLRRYAPRNDTGVIERRRLLRRCAPRNDTGAKETASSLRSSQ